MTLTPGGPATVRENAKRFGCDKDSIRNSWARVFAIVLHLRRLFLVQFLLNTVETVSQTAANVGAQLLALFQSRSQACQSPKVWWWVESFMWDEAALPAKVRRNLYDVASDAEPSHLERVVQSSGIIMPNKYGKYLIMNIKDWTVRS